MSENLNPFVDPRVPAKTSGTGKYWWIILFALAGIAGGIMGWRAYQQQGRRLTHVQLELEELRTIAAQRQADAAELKDKLTTSQSRVADLEKEKENNAKTHGSLEEEMRAQLESKDVTISQLQGKLTVNILDRILFDSGEAKLKPAGETVLEKIAAILQQHPTHNLHVIGHTDNVPIRVGSRGRFASNWELSTARALAAVRFLTETAGVDPRRMGAVGYGEFRPIADNDTAEGRAKNRRIAITILADELAGADSVPLVQTNTSAILPAAPTEPTSSAPEPE